MSFSANIKKELSRAASARTCCARAELCGILLFASSLERGGVRIQTHNPLLLKHLGIVCERAMGYIPSWSASVTGSRHTISLDDPGEMKRIFSVLGYEYRDQLVLHLNAPLVEDDCCRAAFLRGAFLTGGYVTDPERDYSLEFTTTHAVLSRELYALLCDMGMPPKTAKRRYTNVIYFKGSEAIEEILTLMGAPRAAMSIMETKVIKDVRNTINRKVNCETANLLRSVENGNIQLEAIAALKAAGRYEELPIRLKEAAELRERFPDAPLSELAQNADPPITKSGLNHRLKKIEQLYSEMRGEGK